MKWVGVLHEESIAPELYVGVRLDDNGIVSYFVTKYSYRTFMPLFMYHIRGGLIGPR